MGTKWYYKLQMDSGVKDKTNPEDMDYGSQWTVPMSWRELLAIGGWGFVVGLVVAAIYLLFDHFVFGSVLCRQSSAECSNAPTYAIIVAQVVGVILGVGLLARQRVYRPLLVVAATLVTLWTLVQLTSGLAWVWELIWFGILFGLAYMLFSWLSRIRNFVLSLAIIIVAVVILRLFIG